MYNYSILLVILLLTATVPALAAGKVLPKLQNDGRIAIYNYHEDEYAEIQYRDEGGYKRAGLAAIAKIMRSRGDGKTHPIDRRLIEILDHVQDHFGAETIEVISGYRSPSYNDNLRMNGRGAARESLHKKGQAADIHIDEIEEAKLFAYLGEIGVGGVGYYPRYYFVHADVGPPRTWQEAPPKERVMIGTENNPNDAWSAITDRNLYRRGDKISVKVTNNGYNSASLKKNVWLVGFRKGKWSDLERIIKGGTKRLKQGASTTLNWSLPADQRLGKYRLVIFADSKFEAPPAYSNEFYVR